MKKEMKTPQIPTLNLEQPIPPLARTVGSILRPKGIFRFANTIVTVDERGVIAVMNPERFPSWVEGHLAFTRLKKGMPVATWIGINKARMILASEEFRAQLHELKGVSHVRLPVWRGEDETRTVELAEEGFDPATGIFTLDCIPYAEDMDGATAWSVLWEDGLKDFPFHLEGADTMEKSRSFSAQVAAMLGVFCHSLFPEGHPARCLFSMRTSKEPVKVI